jgi:uncharacterized membrane protein YfhO
MASPLNMVAALFPSHMLRDVLAAFIVLRIGLSGLFTAMYLRYATKTRDLLVPAFAAIFALCGYTLGYYHNIMWMDVVAVAPLVMFGLNKLVKEGKSGVYISSLALAIILNFHIAFMVCIFVAIYFFVLCVTNRLSWRVWLRRFGVIALATVAVVGMTAFLTLPTYDALGNLHRQEFSAFPEEFVWISSFDEVIGNLIAFSPPPMFRHVGGGSPQLFSGILPVMLFPIFLLSRNIRTREKTAFLLLLVFLFASVNSNVLQFIWHGFTNTFGFPGRFSFLISFVFVVTAFRAYTKLLKMPIGFEPNIRVDSYKRRVDALAAFCKPVIDPPPGVEALSAMAVGAVFVFDHALRSEHHDQKYIVWSLLLACVYLMLFAVLFSAKQSKSRELSEMVKLFLVVTVSVELIFTSHYALQAWQGTRRDVWVYDEVGNVLAARNTSDENDFFRTDFTRRVHFNDALLHAERDLNSISFFSSSMDGNMGASLRDLGLATNLGSNRYHYFETSPLTNAFLNMRYTVERVNNPAGDDFFWRRVAQDGSVVLLRNNFYLPLGFMVRHETVEWVGDWNNHFEAQNDLFRRSTGLNSNLFESVLRPYVQVSPARQWYDYTMPRDGDLYFVSTVLAPTEILVDGALLRTINTRYRHVGHAGTFREGQVISFAYNGERRGGNVTAGLINRELFVRGHEILSSQTLNLTEFSDTRIRGNITANRSGILYTSIPSAGGNWRVFVNGEARDVVLLCGNMVGVRLDEGTHEIEFRYVNRSFIIGSAISGTTFVLFTTVVTFRQVVPARKRRQKRRVKSRDYDPEFECHGS